MGNDTPSWLVLGVASRIGDLTLAPVELPANPVAEETITVAEPLQVPGPVAALWEWQYQGLCREQSPELFFHPEGERGPARRRRDERAKAVCWQCPVMRQCLVYALAAREPYGVWGGMTEPERQAHLDAEHATPHPA